MTCVCVCVCAAASRGIPLSRLGVSEFSRRPLSMEYQRLDEFRTVFPTEQDPTRLVNEIWDGIGEQQPANGDFMRCSGTAGRSNR